MRGSTARCFIHGRLNFADSYATISPSRYSCLLQREPGNHWLHIVGTNNAGSPTFLRSLGSVLAGKIPVRVRAGFAAASLHRWRPLVTVS
jgi:ABC-type cobalamin transport system ATPase subunit